MYTLNKLSLFLFFAFGPYSFLSTLGFPPRGKYSSTIAMLVMMNICAKTCVKNVN